jgi:hypothetical protein
MPVYTLRRLIDDGILASAMNPLIPGARQLLATLWLSRALPVLAKPVSERCSIPNGYLKRTRYDVQILGQPLVSSADRLLADWFGRWRGACEREGRFPMTMRQFFVTGPEPNACVAAVIDVTATKPQGFEIMAYDGPPARNPVFNRLAQHRRLGAMPYAPLSRTLMADYEAVKLTGVPSLHHLSGSVAGVGHDYHRLIMPCATDGRRIDHLIVITDPRRDRELRVASGSSAAAN